ncbi:MULTISPECIES: metallophosphoesterase [unclassified Butyrivibrio]|uniref:metallophosphoesterase n=1 Tax=unclassified Butyrivibrio TaxID=2639466 RepID=UPI0003B4C2E8|nr:MULTISPECIES: metallophosphoesterase [unclassified Butyrivibrio]MDC7292198.1 metallophosphoesterase [Butyrivibrio sp. DSM 10294]
MWIYIIIAVIIIIVLSIAVIYHDTHSFVVRNYEIETDKIDGEFTFVLLSDLHGYTFGPNNERLIKAVRDIKPDAVLCAGDMFTAHEACGKIRYEAGLHVLTALAGDFPVYAGNGNHERRIKTSTVQYGNLFDRYRSALQRAGVHTIENDSISIPEKNIRISGLDLSYEYFKKVIKKDMEPGHISRLLGDSDRDAFQVLIAHNPQYFPEYSDWGADLTVAGHVHGGIIRLPVLGGVISPAIALFPKYDGGLFERKGKYMVLSRGLGTHSIHVRMFNPGEVCVIKICGR